MAVLFTVKYPTGRTENKKFYNESDAKDFQKRLEKFKQSMPITWTKKKV